MLKFDIGSILIDEKLHKSFFIYDISYKNAAKPLWKRFDKMDGFIRVLIKLNI